MQLTQDQYDEIVMNLVVEGGNARSLAMEAIQAAKKGDFAQADQRMKECEEALVEAHNTQTEMIQAEIRGDHIPVMLLMVHAQDHLMDAMVVKDLAAEIIDLYRARGQETAALPSAETSMN